MGKVRAVSDTRMEGGWESFAGNSLPAIFVTELAQVQYRED